MTVSQRTCRGTPPKFEDPLSREQAAVNLPEDEVSEVDVLPSVARVLSLPGQPSAPAIESGEAEQGDDDADGLEELDEELDFYATALKDVDDDE